MFRSLALVTLLLAGCGKDDPKPSAGPAKPGTARPGPGAATPDPIAAAQRAGADGAGVVALMKRALTSADVDRFLAIEAELKPHRQGLHDAKAAAAYHALAEPICKQHGLSSCLEHNTVQARLKAASMHVQYKVDDAKLDDLQRGDRDVFLSRLADLDGKL